MLQLAQPDAWAVTSHSASILTCPTILLGLIAVCTWLSLNALESIYVGPGSAKGHVISALGDEDTWKESALPYRHPNVYTSVLYPRQEWLEKPRTSVMRGLSRVSCAASVWPFTRYMHLTHMHVVPSKLCRCHRHYMFCPRVSQDPARGPRAHDARQNRASQMGVAGENLSDLEADPVDSLQQLQYSNPTPQRQCNLLSPWLLR